VADLFGKSGATSFGHFGATGVAPEGLDHMQDDNPFSPHFKSRCQNEKDVVRYLIAVQTRRYGKSVDLPERALVRHVKKQAELYSLDLLVRGIAHAATVSLFPFSIGFVTDQIIPEIQRRCPFLPEFPERNKQKK
jgi:hypothetical protein